MKFPLIISGCVLILISCKKKNEEIQNKVGTYLGEQTISYGEIPYDTVVFDSEVEYYLGYSYGEKEYYFTCEDWNYSYEIKREHFSDNKFVYSWKDHDNETYSIVLSETGGLTYRHVRSSQIDQTNMLLQFEGQKQ